MIREITIEMNDGEKKVFKPQGRAGGSFSIDVQYRGDWVVIIDEWYNETAFPASSVKQVNKQVDRNW